MKKFTNPETGSVFTVVDVQRMIDAVTTNGHGLTEWEEGFILDLEEQFGNTNSLTSKQLVVLERLYVNKTPN